MKKINDDLFKRFEKSEISNYKHVLGGLMDATAHSETTFVYAEPRSDFWTSEDLTTGDGGRPYAQSFMGMDDPRRP